MKNSPEAALGPLSDETVVAGVPHRDVRETAAQAQWARLPVSQRLRTVRRFRHLLASCAENAAATASPHLSRAEAVCSEVLPLLDACRFLEKEAAGILASRSPGRRGRPLWLSGVHAEIERVPYGRVLILAPTNYPLFLPGVHLLQALVAGNSVTLKPGGGGAAAAALLARLWRESGLPEGLVDVRSEEVEQGRAALDEKNDLVVLTGSYQTGRRVLDCLAANVTPAVLELSGCDAVFVRDDADLELACRALTTAVGWNAGATCIGPRRIFLARAIAADFTRRLERHWKTLPQVRVDPGDLDRVEGWIEAARRDGARVLCGGRRGVDGFAPVLLDEAQARMALFKSDIMVPLAGVLVVDDDAEAVRLSAECPFALGATIFGRETGARALASRLGVGVVVINDALVPTADPRLPFGGTGASGYGVTRGAEGLLALTRPRVLVVRRGRNYQHLEPPREGDDAFFLSYVRSVHGSGWIARLRALRELFIRALRRRSAPLVEESQDATER